MTETKAIVRYAGDELFIGISPSGHAQVLDTNHDRATRYGKLVWEKYRLSGSAFITVLHVREVIQAELHMRW